MKVLEIDIGYLLGTQDDGYILRSDGTVVGARGGLLAPRVNSKGYVAVRVRTGWRTLHRLLALAFIPNPDRLPQVNHKDGDKLNNSLDNLEWGTQRHNLYHAMDTGLHAWGRSAVTNGVHVFPSQAEAARQTGAAQSNINKCIMGDRRTAGGYMWRSVA